MGRLHEIVVVILDNLCPERNIENSKGNKNLEGAALPQHGCQGWPLVRTTSVRR